MKKIQACAVLDVFILQESLLLLSILLSAVSFVVVPQNGLAAEPGIGGLCCVCHNDTCEVNLDKSTVHPPFLQKQCAFCHVDDGSALETLEDGSAPQKIIWFGDHYTPATMHWFVIPGDLINRNKLIVAARDVMGKSHEVEMSLPALEAMQPMVNDNKPPVISSSEVIGVYRGVTTSARIGWLTDEESDSEIRYGIDSLQHSVKADEFTVNHEIVLQNLKPGQQYQYIVISRDIFNNTAESDIALFSTENLLPYQPLEFEGQEEANIQLGAQVFRNDDSFMVKITANQPVVLSVGSETITKKEKDFETLNVNHPTKLPPLRSGNTLLISVCLQCHSSRRHSLNHPVNISPSPKVTIPAGYAINSAGRITCTSCHASHASNFSFRTVRSSSQALCKGCHGGISLPEN